MVQITNPNYAQYCGNRLPCGYCRLMGSICPLQPTITTPSWDTTPITTTTTSTTVELNKENKL